MQYGYMRIEIYHYLDWHVTKYSHRTLETANFFLMFAQNDFHPTDILPKHTDFRAHPRPARAFADETERRSWNRQHVRGRAQCPKADTTVWPSAPGLALPPVTGGELPDPCGLPCPHLHSEDSKRTPTFGLLRGLKELIQVKSLDDSVAHTCSLGINYFNTISIGGKFKVHTVSYLLVYLYP